MDRIALPKTKGCLIEYTYIEVIHAAIQIILAFFGIVLSWLLAKYYYSAVDVKRFQHTCVTVGGWIYVRD